jgi:hypothetical protein
MARPGADALTAMQPKPITRPYPVCRSAEGTGLLKMRQTTDPKYIAFPGLTDRRCRCIGHPASPSSTVRGGLPGSRAHHPSSRPLAGKPTSTSQAPTTPATPAPWAADIYRRVRATEGTASPKANLPAFGKVVAMFSAEDSHCFAAASQAHWELPGSFPPERPGLAQSSDYTNSDMFAAPRTLVTSCIRARGRRSDALS